MTYAEALELVEATQILHEILDDNEKVAKWLVTENLNLGGATPMVAFFNGRGHKVLAFIRAAEWENSQAKS